MTTNTEVRAGIHLPYEITKARFKLHERRRNALHELVEYARQIDDVAASDFNILDVGCGRGEFMNQLRNDGFETQGVDLDPECVAISQKHGPCQISTVEDLPDKFEDNSFDLVVCSHVLEHTLSPLHAVECLSHVTNKWLVLAVPNPVRPHILLKNLQRKRYSNLGHVVAWDRSHFHNFLTEYAQLEIEKWQTDHVRLVGHSLLNMGGGGRGLGVIDYVEVKFLPKVFPFFSDSLIALCRVKGS